MIKMDKIIKIGTISYMPECPFRIVFNSFIPKKPENSICGHNLSLNYHDIWPITPEPWTELFSLD